MNAAAGIALGIQVRAYGISGRLAEAQRDAVADLGSEGIRANMQMEGARSLGVGAGASARGCRMPRELVRDTGSWCRVMERQSGARA